MLKEIIDLWKGEGFMKQVIEKFGEMLGDAEFVFTRSWQMFIGEVSIDVIKQTIYDKDRSINSHEKEIRRMILEHLSINPRQDVSGCLAMMGLVKDAERIGDYAKNIFELGVMFHGMLKEMEYLGQLSSLQKKIAERFPKLNQAFMESDENLARELLKGYADIKSECDKILQSLFKEIFSAREAVATALLSRYLKRINSHMSNIASGIIYPLDQIDFVRGDLLE